MLLGCQLVGVFLSNDAGFSKCLGVGTVSGLGFPER